MAIAPFPSPFFVPMYAPPSVLPTPPFGFGAPPYAPYPPPNPIHHHPLPPPSPPYHYAAVYPPPPPGFVPVPASPTPIHHPSAPYSSSSHNHFPSTAYSCTKGYWLESPAPPAPSPSSGGYCSAPAQPYEPQWPPPAPNPPTIQAPPQPTTTSSTPNSYPGRCFQPPPAQPVTTTVPIPLLAESSSPTSPTTAPASRTVQRHATDRFTDRLPSTVGQAACAPSSDEDDREQDAVQRRAIDLFLVQTPFDAIQGQFAKLTSMASQLAISLSKHSTSPHTSTPAASAAAPASAVSQVFGEMPTPNFLQETHGTDPRNCSRHHIPIQSTCVSNFSEQNFGEMAQEYDVHNLNCKSVVPEPMFAVYDESDSSSTESIPLFERLPVFDAYDDDTNGSSTEYVCVFPSKPEQQPYEEEQQETAQFLTCISKATGTEESSACLNMVTDVLDVTLELQQQDDEKISVYLQQLRAPPSHGLVIHETRKAWDPGVHTIPGEFQFDVSKCCVPQQCDSRVPSRRINHGFLWDPGICNPMDLMPEETAVANPVHTMPTPFTLLKTVVQPIELNQFGAHLFLQCHSGCTTPNGFLQVQYCCLPTVLDCLYSEPDKQVVSYSSMFSSAATCMSTAATMCMRLALSSGKLTQAGKNAAALHQVLKMQLQMTNSSRIWDPGVRKFLCSWLTILTGWSATDKQFPCTSITDVAAEPNHSLCSALLLQLLFTQEKINWHEDIKCYGVALSLINFQVP